MTTDYQPDDRIQYRMHDDLGPLTALGKIVRVTDTTIYFRLDGDAFHAPPSEISIMEAADKLYPTDES